MKRMVHHCNDADTFTLFKHVHSEGVFKLLQMQTEKKNNEHLYLTNLKD